MGIAALFKLPVKATLISVNPCKSCAGYFKLDDKRLNNSSIQRFNTKIGLIKEFGSD